MVNTLKLGKEREHQILCELISHQACARRLTSGVEFLPRPALANAHFFFLVEQICDLSEFSRIVSMFFNESS
jgi:hypothetical protein